MERATVLVEEGKLEEAIHVYNNEIKRLVQHTKRARYARKSQEQIEQILELIDKYSHHVKVLERQIDQAVLEQHQHDVRRAERRMQKKQQKSTQAIWEGLIQEAKELEKQDRLREAFETYEDAASYLIEERKQTQVKKKKARLSEQLRKCIERCELINALLQEEEKQSITNWSSEQVCQWICGLGSAYAIYAEEFERSGIDGEMLVAMNEQHLIELGIQNGVHREKILRTMFKMIQDGL